MARIVERLAAKRWLPVLGIWALTCSVDHRHLRLGLGSEGSSAGESAAFEDGAAGATPATNNPDPEGGAAGTGQAMVSSAGTAGSSPSTELPPLVHGCADLDTDSVADCTVTLVKNPTFKSDVTSWTAVDTATLAWDPRNALGDTPSGCALLSVTGASDSDGSAFFSATQCVAVPASQTVIAYANALIGAPAAAGDPAQAELQVSFFDGADCAGQPTGQFFTPPSPAATWVTIQAGGLSGPATTSASVALVGIKPNRADALSVCFDNVMIKTKPPSS